MIHSLHERVRGILGSARQLVCRTRPREATVINHPLRGAGLPDSHHPGRGLQNDPVALAIYSIPDAFFFRGADKLECLLASIRWPVRTLILRMGGVPYLDAGSVVALRELVVALKRRGALVLLVEVRSRVLQKLVRAGLIAHLGADNVIASVSDALLRLNAIEHFRQR